MTKSKACRMMTKSKNDVYYLISRRTIDEIERMNIFLLGHELELLQGDKIRETKPKLKVSEHEITNAFTTKRHEP